MSLEDDLKIISRQEQRLQFKAFDESAAWDLGCRLRQAAVAGAFPLVIEVKRFSHPLFFCAMPGSTPDNVDWARRKANTVARFQRSSYGMGLDLQLKGITLADRFGLMLTDYAAHGGGFPITVEGTGVIGSVTVSGLPQREDHQLVVEVICAMLGQNSGELQLSTAP